MQIYGSSGAALFPEDGYTLINGMPWYYTSLKQLRNFPPGIASSVIENMPEHWDWRHVIASGFLFQLLIS